MKQKLILSLLAMTFCIMAVGSVLATSTKVTGSVDLVWNNYGSYPQDLSGTISGDLTGTINVISNSLYDASSTTVGLTNGDITANIDGIDCQGVYAGSNINSGVDTGSFTLVCGDKFYNGILYGSAQQDSNGDWTIMQLTYTAFSLESTPGPKGDKGDTGEQGLQGIPGENGKDGVDGIDGINGINGQDGSIGPAGPQGEQGIQGIPGVKGDTGATGPQGVPGTNATVDLNPILSRLSILEDFKAKVLTFFTDFAGWFNQPNPCINGQYQCSGNNQQKCVNYAWVNQQTCQYGCANGVCNNPPIVCTAGQLRCLGNMTQSCNNNAWVNGTNCALGCVNGVCNQPLVCTNGEYRCSGNFTQICQNKVWVSVANCPLGCANTHCILPPVEDCTKKQSYVCSNGYSVPVRWSCPSSQGINTYCNVGKCINNLPSYSYQWQYMYKQCGSKGCNSTTGLCII